MKSTRAGNDSTTSTSSQVMEFIPPELNLFTSLPIQTAVLSEMFQFYNPLTTLDKCTNIQFQINGFEDKYIDMSNIYLKLQIQLVKSNGAAYETTEKDSQAYIINNSLHSIFRALSVELNSQVVSNTQFYHYKSYLEDLLNFQKPREESIMNTQGFILDTNQLDAFDDNHGATNRFEKTKESKTLELYGRIHADVFNMQKWLISGVNMKINFDLEKKEFYLMNVKEETKSELKIIEASVLVRYLQISPTMLLAHHKMLQNQNIPYNFKRTVMKNFLIPSNVNGHNIENVFSGQLPTNLLIVFVENDAFFGKTNKNPFNFKHFNLSHLQLNVNGNNVPSQPLTMNSDSNLIAKAYHDLHLGLNYANKDFGIMFTETSFLNGFAIFAFDLTPTKTPNVINLMSENGILKVDLKFRKPLPSPASMLVYAEFNNSFEVTSSKNIIVNY